MVGSGGGCRGATVGVGCGVKVGVGEGVTVGVEVGVGVLVAVGVEVGPGVGVLTLTIAFSPITISTSSEAFASPARADCRSTGTPISCRHRQY